MDLSQLRLTKKDLETLSSLTPSLSKNIQEQLLAQLPPNQAKKLSRTLSVQNGKKSSPSTSTTKTGGESTTTQIYRRSMSTNPRDVASRFCRDSVTPTNDLIDKINNNKNGGGNSSNNGTTATGGDNRYRRSSSRDDSLNNNSSREATPTSIKTTNDYRGQYYSNLKPLTRINKDDRKSYLNEDYAQTCFSPEPIEEKPKHKRLSRFLSPDNTSTDYQLYDEPRKFTPRELETHKILRELCENVGVDNNRDSREKSVEKESRISYFLEKYATSEISKHLLNGSNEGNQLRKNSSRSDTASSSHSHLSSVSEKILDELNSMSLLNDQLEKFDAKELQSHEKKKKTTREDGTVIRKKKVKEKSPEKSLDESRSEDLSERSSSRSKIARPKSSLIKDSAAALKTSEKIIDEKNSTLGRYSRPKSFPSSKITPPKEIQFPDSLANILNAPKEPSPPKSKTIPLENTCNETVSNSSEPIEQTKKTKKIIKVVKKSSKSVSSTIETETTPNLANVDEKREKSPEKKSNKGLLYTIGQKFEKLRGGETKTSKESTKKSSDAIECSTTTSDSTVTTSTSSDLKEKKKKIKALLSEDVDETTRQERKSKIDAMIKNLREKSLPHNNELTESGLIKRAVSVEEMPNIFNKNAVNKVLGLFKRIEKENTATTAISTSPQNFEYQTTKVQNTKSSSYLSYCDDDDYDSRASSSSRERPKSSGFSHKQKKNGSAFEPLDNIAESKIPVKYSSTCPDCKESTSSSSISNETVAKRHSSEHQKIVQSLEERERIRNNRKGLMLDLVTDPTTNSVKKSSSSKQNYSFPPPLPQDMNHLTTPTYDSLTNYSSSPFDCSSTPLSPTDDVGFDRWSTCSEESQLPPHPMGSLSLSRLSRSIHNQSLLDDSESPESVVDRIRRKSFYSRFNEKKPKRVSTIVGPAAKEYYRERSRPLEYTKSATSVIPDISERCSSERREIPSSTAQSSHSHARSLSSTRHSSAASAAASSTPSTSATHHRSLSQARKYSTEKPIADSSLQHSSYMASLPPPYHHHHHHHDIGSEDYSTRIRNNRNTMYDSSSSSSNNNTPTPLSSLYQRRSYVSTPSSSSTTTTMSSAAMKPPLSFVDGYATIGRKMRQYNTRSVSLLDPSIMNTTNNYSNDHHHRMNGYGDYNESSRFV